MEKRKEGAVMLFQYIAGVLFIAGFVPYILAIICRKTKPVKITWFIWASLDTMILVGMYTENALNGQIVGIVLGAWTVAFLSLKYGLPGWTKFDKFCLGSAILGTALWQLLDDPAIGILAGLTVITIASIPTFVSAWKDPRNEDKIGWTIFWSGCVFSVIAIPQWTLADAVTPITFLATETVMVFILYFRPRPLN